MRAVSLTNCTVGELKELLNDIPDHVRINIMNSGNTGVVKDVTLSIKKGAINSNVCINIDAEKLK